MDALYQHLLRRDPDPAGLAAWTTALAQHGDPTVTAGLTGSDEYYGRAR